jgi:hypothetical protein
MKTARTVWKFLWKTSAVAGAFLVGSMAANQAGWSGAEMVVNSPGIVTVLFFSVGTVISLSAAMLIQRIAKPLLWVLAPFLLYSAIVLGAWDGIASDFDATRLEAIKHHSANAYALERMSERGRFLSCQDDRIELTQVANTVCSRASIEGQGEPAH